jgi:hypothetical protein
MPLRPSDLETIKEIWIKRGRYESSDEETRSKKCVFVPGHLDVLLGRGRRCQEHIGNMRLRNLVDDCKPVYDIASRQEKTLISQDIVVSVQKTSSYFLKEEGAGWLEVDDNVARLKVSHTFRDALKEDMGEALTFTPIALTKKREREY